MKNFCLYCDVGKNVEDDRSLSALPPFYVFALLLRATELPKPGISRQHILDVNRFTVSTPDLLFLKSFSRNLKDRIEKAIFSDSAKSATVFYNKAPVTQAGF
ncbi:MAG: hypothetical protein IPH20_12775 [Bacteroidales bacterium]|nr:hypothetical protein [Bacteroidales bacterium]